MKVASTLWKEKINGEEIEFLVCPYMVGDILTTTNNIDPSARYKGTTWQKIEEETFLMSASETYPVKTTGGENEHTLTVDEMPSHNHTISNNGNAKFPITINAETGGTGYNINYSYGTKSEPRLIADNKGGSKAHNNMPKFYAVYFWLRVA